MFDPVKMLGSIAESPTLPALDLQVCCTASEVEPAAPKWGRSIAVTVRNDALGRSGKDALA
jgi:hypothetical protein